METAHTTTATGSLGAALNTRARTFVIVLALLATLLASVIAAPKAGAAQTMQPFGQWVDCYNGYWGTQAIIYPGAFSSNGYLAYPTQKAYYYAVTPAGSSEVLTSGWTYSVTTIDTAYLAGTFFDFYLYTAWTDPGVGNQWTSTGDFVYLGRC
jgi:hypothetical protein